MKILIAIDGAALLGETNSGYEERYSGSFVQRIYERAAERAYYFQGAMIVTGDVSMQAREVSSWVIEHSSQDDEIGFVGYSRGGAACLVAAGFLDAMDSSARRNVTAVGLFDPVGNQIESDYHCGHTELSRTEVCIARRDQDLDSMLFPPLELNAHIQRERSFSGAHGDFCGSDTTEDAYNWIAEFLADHDLIV